MVGIFEMRKKNVDVKLERGVLSVLVVLLILLAIDHLSTIHCLSHLHYADSPIRIHHSHRLSHAEFNLFLFFFFLPPHSFKISLTAPHVCYPVFLFLFVSFLHNSLSPEYYLSLSRQTDFGWVTQYASPLLSPSVGPCSSITTLSLKGQKREWKSSHFPHLRQSDIYGGTVHLLGNPCSFWRKTAVGRGRMAGGCCKEDLLKRVESWKMRLEKCDNSSNVWG